MVSSTTKERILLHLSKYYNISRKQEVPYEVTQPGISDSIGVSRSYLSQEIRRIISEEGIIEEEIRHVKGSKRRRKVYFLTGEGFERSRKTQQRLEKKKVTIVTSNDKFETYLGNIEEYIEGRNPLLTALLLLDENDEIDLREEVNQKENVFVGRSDELDKLKEKFREVKDGNGKTIFVIGRAGIGKTSLVSEFGRYTEGNDALFLDGKAYFETSDPFLPFRTIFKELEEIYEGIDFDKLFNFGISGSELDNKDIFTSQRRALFYDTSEILRKISEKKPLILFIDDLQWADGGTLKLFHYLSENLTDSRVMLLGAYRPRDKNFNSSLKEISQRMLRDRIFDSIELNPLDQRQTKYMISDLVGVNNIPSNFIQKVYEHCEGNPLFTREVINQLLEEGSINPKKNIYPSSEAELDIPDMATGILERRFEQLSKDSRRVLEYGGVIGEEVPLKVISQLCDMDELKFLEIVDELLRSKLWKEDEERGKFNFSHRLIRLAAYRSLSSIKQKRLHKMVADILKEVYKDHIEEYYSDIGMHLERSDKTEEAIEYYILAGDRDESVYAHEEAIEMYKKALELVEDTPDTSMKKEILERLADVYNVLGMYEKSEECYQKSMMATEDKEHHQRIYRKMADIDLKRCIFEGAINKVDHGLNMAKTEGVLEERCKLLQIKGWAYMLKGQHKKAAEIFSEEMALAESMIDPNRIGEALHDLGTLHLRSGDYKYAEKYLKRSIENRKEADDERGLAKTYNNIAAVYKIFNDLDRSLEYSQKSLEIIKKVGDKRGMAGGLQNIGNLHYMKKEFKKAEDSLRRAYEIFKSIGNQRGMAMALDNMGMVYTEKGDLQKALGYHERGIEISEEIGEDFGVALSSANLATVLRERGEYSQALTHYGRAADIFERLGDKHNLAISKTHIGDVYAYMNNIEKSLEEYNQAKNIKGQIEGEPAEPRVDIKIAEAYLELEDLEKVRSHLKETEKRFQDREDMLQRAKVHRIRGMLKAKEESIKKALEHLSEAKKISEDLAVKKELARCLLEEGKVLVQAGKNKKGEEAIKKSLEIYESLGRDHWISVCEGYL